MDRIIGKVREIRQQIAQPFRLCNLCKRDTHKCGHQLGSDKDNDVYCEHLILKGQPREVSH